jgi:prephenate dehydrogenase
MRDFERVGIFGVGLIGGSLGMAIKKFISEVEIYGYDKDLSSLEEALKLKAIDKKINSFSEVSQLDLIFIATPVSEVCKVVKEISSYLSPNTVITDTASTKEEIVKESEKFLPENVFFIGGHPLAGSEREGVLGASPDLFKNAFYVLTPTEKTNSEAFLKLHSFIKKIGANIVALEPKRHDLIVAYISHVPHLSAACIVNLARRAARKEEGLLFFAASGFRDATRIAAGSSELWRDILMANRKAVLKALEEMKSELNSFEKALQREDQNELEELLRKAREARMNLPAFLHKDLTKLWVVKVPVEDRPGTLSEITVALGKIGVNIEDIEIVHGEGRGVLKLTVMGEENAQKSVKELRKLNYEPIFEPFLEGE